MGDVNVNHRNVNHKQSGFVVNLRDPLPKRLKCPLCNNLMRDPLQTVRGESACGECYTQRKSSDGTCPIDGEPIFNEETFKDRGKAMEIWKLACFCQYKAFGCPWQGVVREAEQHQFHCQFEPKQCCFCNDEITSGKESEHLQICTYLLKDKCCIFKHAGCNYKPSGNDDLMNHLQEEWLMHAIYPAVSLRLLETKGYEIRKEFMLYKKNTDQMERKMQGQIEELSRKLIVITTEMEGMQREINKLRNYDTKKAKDNGPVSTGFINTDSISKEIQSLTANVSGLNTNLSDLHLGQQIYENTTYDGRIVWKIDKFKTRLQQAVTRKVTVLHSAPSFTTKYGYRFCGRLYLNGDGMGKCTHTSIFIVVMKSEYDGLLEWPFNRRVSFNLLNQENQSQNVTESFHPDSNSSSFQRPTKEMNIAAGCPMFVRKAELLNGGFVKDDSIFIEIMTT